MIPHVYQNAKLGPVVLLRVHCRSKLWIQLASVFSNTQETKNLSELQNILLGNKFVPI